MHIPMVFEDITIVCSLGSTRSLSFKKDEIMVMYFVLIMRQINYLCTEFQNY
jgi:hypothetical protein